VLTCAIYQVPMTIIKERMPEIIAFSELDGAIDEPVKHYSSGMLARLGFSIAIHILSPILFLDEILAVGDIAFRQKCEERLLSLRDSEITLLIASHNDLFLSKICKRALWLHQGKLMMDGELTAVIEAYRQHSGVPSQRSQE